MQLLRIASVLFILHICYHPRLFISSAPIKDSSDVEVEEIHTNDEHETSIAEILNSTTFANITNSLLRFDNYNTGNPFDLSIKSSLPYIIRPSPDSLIDYLEFKKETCRTTKEDIQKSVDQDFLENGYFKWEENEFHRELRIL
uniref:Uncharacterized protein n=1 Tax=Panagrolaimus sp. ES5 TaxID=591445 RepID=A0AC34FQ60_9BILA